MIGTEVGRPSEREVVFSRLIAAPPALVWDLWSELRHLHAWFGPRGFTTTTQEFNFAPGGVWRFTMHAPNGKDNANRIVFRVIEPKSRIVYTNSWDMHDAPIEFSAQVNITAEGTGTRLQLHFTFRDEVELKVAVDVYGVLPGGVETFERIANYVET